jgi:hypothetical protein
MRCTRISGYGSDIVVGKSVIIRKSVLITFNITHLNSFSSSGPHHRLFRLREKRWPDHRGSEHDDAWTERQEALQQQQWLQINGLCPPASAANSRDCNQSLMDSKMGSFWHLWILSFHCDCDCVCFFSDDYDLSANECCAAVQNANRKGTEFAIFKSLKRTSSALEGRLNVRFCVVIVIRYLHKVVCNLIVILFLQTCVYKQL